MSTVLSNISTSKSNGVSRINLVSSKPKSTSSTVTIATNKEKLKTTQVPAAVVDDAVINQAKKFDVFIPLKGVMESALKDVGITPITYVARTGNHSEGIKLLTEQFYNEIVRKSQTNHFTGAPKLPEVHIANYPVDHSDEVVDAVITGVMAYINGLIAKKEGGGELSKVENTIVSGAEKASFIAQDQAKKSMAAQVGDTLLFKGGWVWIIIAIIVVVLLISFFRKK